MKNQGRHVPNECLCRGCDQPIEWGARFCTLCLELPPDLPEVDNWRTGLLWALRCQDNTRVGFIQDQIKGYQAIIIDLPVYKNY